MMCWSGPRNRFVEGQATGDSVSAHVACGWPLHSEAVSTDSTEMVTERFPPNTEH
jgi:hypothetical protein